ncbi:MAG: hypothetical protein AB7O52_13925 [Planctomycetota bacterium]
MSARRWMVIATLSCAGCDALPYRVEWGRRDSDAADTAPTSVVAEIKDPPASPLSPSERLASWETLHKTLVRRVSSRQPGDPLPLDHLATCQRGLVRLGEALPAHVAAFERATRLYERLAERGAAASLAWSQRVLREVEDEVAAAVAAAGQPAAPPTEAE